MVDTEAPAMRSRSLSGANRTRVGLVIVGADLDTGVRRTLPALFRLYCSQNVLTEDLKVVALCTQMTSCENATDAAFAKCSESSALDLKRKLGRKLGPGDQEAFLARCEVVTSDFRRPDTAAGVAELLKGYSQVIVYFIPTLILKANDAAALSAALQPQCVNGGFFRCIIEKPQGRCLASARALSDGLRQSFGGDSNVYRLDHFLGKTMVQNIVALRFANRFLEPSWNNNHINAVVISCREVKLCTGHYLRYFDKFGIIREIMMDHLLHIMALVAMETPLSIKDVRSEVIKVLRCVRPVQEKDVVLGQYAGYGNGELKAGESKTPTFATCVLYIDNPRWYGVPFILKAGKGMYERRTDIRVQFKNPHNLLFPEQKLSPNELVIRVQPGRDIYMKMMRQVPGKTFDVKVTKLDFLGFDPSMMLASSGPPGMPGSREAAQASSTGSQSNDTKIAETVGINAYIPDSYERLIKDVILGDRTYFAVSQELEALFSVFDPLLTQLDTNAAGFELISYPVGSRGPHESYQLMERAGFLEYKLASELLGTSPVKTELQRFSRDFSLSLYQMEEIITHFLAEFQAGLRGDPGACIKMLPSYVTSVPDGMESGVYYALDLGGTNFRVTRFKLDGKGGVFKSDERKFTVPDALMLGTGDQLFDFLAECVASLELPEDRTYGFTFSFPIEQHALAHGTLIKWNKGFTTSGVVGKDVVELLSKALEKRGFKARINALANDTVGTLVSSAYSDPRTMVGVILGTGTNAAYRERVDRITKLPAQISAKGGEMIINTEWGNFGSTIAGQLPVSEVDDILDKASRNPGLQRFEKTISGMYLGEIARLILEKMHAAGEIWASPNTFVPDCIKETNAWPTRYLSDIEYDMSEDLEVVQHVEELFGVLRSTVSDRLKLKEVCGMVISRAAKLTACAITATLRQMGPERANGCTVGIDGSVYEHHPSFRMRLRQALGELGCQCHVVLAKDGSGQGSALIACGADKHK